MRHIEVEIPENLSVEDNLIGFADWKESPQGVLDHVDTLLKPYGLEVVMISEGFATDCFHWRIERRVK